MQALQNLPYSELSKTLSWILWFKNIDLAVTEKIGGILLFDGKKSCLKRIRGYGTGEEGDGGRYSFAR